MKFVIYLLFSLLLQASNARILTYNLLNYENEPTRNDEFISIIDFIDPDLIVIEEVVSHSGYNNFQSHVLDVYEPNEWLGATFTNQSAQQDIALYYRPDIFSFVSTSTINTASSSGLRDVVEFIMIHESSGIEFRIYGVHLKASSGSSNATERLAEVTILRDYLNELSDGTYFMVVGDFNIYSNSSSSEPAFDMLTGDASDNDGRLFDPIDRIGPWHNNNSYADVHTQSPRTISFGGGATGGMDDRFDWIFASASILDQGSDMHYIEDTYTAVGNDGNHFNGAINNGSNSSVSDAIADALHDASDHLPVYMDVWFDDLVYTEYGIIITEIMPNPSAVSDSYGEWFEIHNTTDSTIDINGWSIKDGGSDDYYITNTVMFVPIVSGDYFVFSRNGYSELNGGLDVDHEYSGFLLSNSEDEIILLDASGAIVDEVHYASSWDFGSGVSMEIHEYSIENNLEENWHEASLSYGSGDRGTPGSNFEGLMDIEISKTIPSLFELFTPYPNPFNPTTTIRFSSEKFLENSLLQIYNIKGHIVETLLNKSIHPGDHKVKWNAKFLPSGVYFIKFTDGQSFQIQKVVLVK